MGWLDNLKAKVGDVEVSFSGAKSSRKTKMPRDTVLAAIDHSIAYHKDATYTLPSGRSKGKKPSLIYSVSADGTKATVQLPYGKARLKFGPVGDQATFDANKLRDGLEQIRIDVAAGALDKQLAKLEAAKPGAKKKSTTTPSVPAGTAKVAKPKKAK